MHVKKKVFTLLLGIGFFITSCTKDSIALVENGKSNHEIMFMDNATESQYKSAEVLQSYIEKISGAKLDIVDQSSQSGNKHKIYIGNTKEEELNAHQISIKSEKENLFISGGSDEATKYAVYEFLERYLGCKWYAPNVEEVPTSTSITVPLYLNFTYTPDITTRTVHSRLFYENPVFADKQKVTYKAFPYYVPEARVHTFHKFIPEEKFYLSNPEYFALRGDKRLPTQLCLTNVEVLNIVKDSVRALFEKHPESSVISVSSNDNTQYCECENCKKIDTEEASHAGTMIRFVNEVANAFPKKTISTLAYQYTRKPSKTRPANNVLITLCSIECDRSASIEEKCIDFADDLRGWHKLTDNIRIWDYTTQFTNFLAPFPNIHTLQPNIDFFRDNDAKWVFEQHSNNPSELFELRSYLTAKLLWNPDANMDSLTTGFVNGYYGKAGSFVKKYIDSIHSKLKEDKQFFLFLYGDPSQAFTSYLNPDLLTEYNKLFNEAEKSVADTPELLQRVKVARLGVDYAVLEACRKNISERYSLVGKADKDGASQTTDVGALLEKFKSTCEKADITLMNEMGFMVDDYFLAYQKAMEVAKLPNKASGKKVGLLTKPKKYADEDPQVLTDGALGGNNFYANWLGFEGNDMEVTIDLETLQDIKNISVAYLQVTNHIVFFPTEVTYYYSNDNKSYVKIGTVNNVSPLTKKSKVNDLQYFDLHFDPKKARYIKIKAKNIKKAPYWHHAADLPSWIFADEVIIN